MLPSQQALPHTPPRTRTFRRGGRHRRLCLRGGGLLRLCCGCHLSFTGLEVELHVGWEDGGPSRLWRLWGRKLKGRWPRGTVQHGHLPWHMGGREGRSMACRQRPKGRAAGPCTAVQNSHLQWQQRGSAGGNRAGSHGDQGGMLCRLSNRSGVQTQQGSAACGFGPVPQEEPSAPSRWLHLSNSGCPLQHPPGMPLAWAPWWCAAAPDQCQPCLQTRSPGPPGSTTAPRRRRRRRRCCCCPPMPR